MFRSIRNRVRLAGRSNHQHAAVARAAAATACCFESMEARQLMSASLSSSSGNLTVLGTNGNDSIGISISRSKNTLTVNDNGVNRTFALNQVKSLYVNMLEGDDIFGSSQTLYAPMVIYGGGGDDRLSGGGGNDQIYAGNGNDTIFNSVGADIMSGEAGNDQVSYATSNAKVSVTLDDVANDGQNAPGYISASYEKDNVRSDVESVEGSSFDDFLSAESLYGKGITLDGLAGKDYVVGSNQVDALYGGTGDDTIMGLRGTDHIYGGLGADLMDGGTGTGVDALHYDDTREGRTTGVTVSLPEPTVTGYEGNNGAAGENDRIREFESVWGTNFKDGLSGNMRDNYLFGMAGNDTIQGRGGADSIWGQAGNDLIWGDAGYDMLYGGADNDTIYGGSEADKLYGEEGNDFLYDKDGAYSDTFSGGTGADTIVRDDFGSYIFTYRPADLVVDGEYIYA